MVNGGEELGEARCSEEGFLVFTLQDAGAFRLSNYGGQVIFVGLLPGNSALMEPRLLLVDIFNLSLPPGDSPLGFLLFK